MVPMTAENPTALPQRLEAVLMTADRPMSETRLLEVLELVGDEAPLDDANGPSPKQLLREAIDALNTTYDDSSRSFRITKVAGGWQVLTLPAFTSDITRLKGARQLAKLSPAALETLAIIAYKQPILRTDIESIRGVACGEMLRSLMERRLVKIAGRAEEVGRPMLYGTTREFLEVFGLASLSDLPNTDS
jgi:segregation and condensation protein B